AWRGVRRGVPAPPPPGSFPKGPRSPAPVRTVSSPAVMNAANTLSRNDAALRVRISAALRDAVSLPGALAQPYHRARSPARAHSRAERPQIPVGHLSL